MSLAWGAVAEAQPRFEIDVARDLGPVSRDVYGANLEHRARNAPDVAAFTATFPVLRFPGGDAESAFHWDVRNAGVCGMRWDWPAVASLAQRHGLGLFLETNILDGPERAARWVADARGRGLRVAMVGVGNETWGDFDRGYRTAARYAADVRAQATAIRAMAPGARIAAAFGTHNEDTWNRAVVRATADVIDAVDVHWYPNHREGDEAVPAEIMANPEAIPALLARIRRILREEAPSRAAAIQVVLGEFDCAEDPPFDSADLVTPRAYSQWAMPNAVCWGAIPGELLHGGVSLALFYSVQGHRFGALQGNECTPGDARVRRPKVLALQLWRDHFGDRLVPVTPRGVPTYYSDGPPWWDGFTGTAPTLRVYASTAEGGRALRLIVVSRSERTAIRATFDLRSFVPAAEARAWELAGASLMATNENVGGAPDAVRIVERSFTVPGATFTYNIPAHSVTALEFRSRTAGPSDAGTDAGPRDVGVDVARDVGTDAARDVGMDAARDASEDAGEARDAGALAEDVASMVEDVASMVEDVTTAMDAGDAAGPPAPSPTPEGCGCRLAGRAAPDAALRTAALGGVAALLGRRRRRR